MKREDSVTLMKDCEGGDSRLASDYGLLVEVAVGVCVCVWE